MKHNLLQAHDDRAVRAALVTGLGVLRKREPGRTCFGYLPVVQEVAKTLITGPELTEAANTWNSYQGGYTEDPQRKEEEHPDNRKLLAAIWSLVADGIVFPRLSHNRDGYPSSVDKVVLTERGQRVLDTGDQHPLHPGFVSRFKSRCPVMSDEVVARVEDAVSCVEKSLLRASVVMIGLAVEETLRVTHAAMVYQAHIGKAATTMTKFKNLLDDIEKATQSWTNQNDEQHRLTMAIAAAESIRTERNKASHPGVVVSDGAAVEELLILASRQTPIFWEIPIQQAVSNGFVIP